MFELLVSSPISVIFILHVSVTWYTTCGTCTVLGIVTQLICVDLQVPDINTETYTFLDLAKPNPSSKPVSVPSICTCTRAVPKVRRHP